MSAFDELHEFIADELVPIDLEVAAISSELADNSKWEITDMGGADWAARKITQARRRCAEAEAAAAAERAIIAEFVDAAQREATRVEAFFAGHLRRWHEALLAEDPKRKTISLPSGAKIQHRVGGNSVEVTDEASFVAWCKAEGLTDELCTVKPSKSAIRAAQSLFATTEDGEFVEAETGAKVPGVALRDSGPSWSVVTPKAGE